MCLSSDRVANSAFSPTQLAVLDFVSSIGLILNPPEPLVGENVSHASGDHFYPGFEHNTGSNSFIPHACLNSLNDPRHLSGLACEQ